MTERKIKRLLLMITIGLLSVALVCLLTVAVCDTVVRSSASKHILSAQEASSLEGMDCVLVLGCKVRGDGSPSAMLRDRLKVGVALYELGAAPKLLMSGDHGRTDYDEVDAMKQFAVDRGIATSDVFMDHAGFSTYESMYRAKEVFGVKKLVIVTQGYHLYRAVYIARQLGLEAYGVSASLTGYSGQFGRDVREVLARVKDFFSCVFLPEPTYLGETIPIGGDGDLTNDEQSDFDG